VISVQTQSKIIGAAILPELETWRKELAKAEDTLRHLVDRLSDLKAILGSLPDPWPKEKDLLVFPSPNDLVLKTGSLRVTRLSLTISSLILPCIILVNTGMLAQIIRDLGIIPPNYQFGPVPLNVVFALILTLIEAAWGFVHGATSARSSDEGELEKIRVLPIVAVLIALGLGFLEGYFYSQIAPSSAPPFPIPIVGYKIPQSDFFFFWGFALVMALFVLGKTFYDSFAAVRRGTALGEIRRQVEEMVSLASRWKDTTAEAKGNVGKIAEQVTSIDVILARLLPGSASAATNLTQAAAAAFEQLRKDMIKLDEPAAPQAEVSKKELTIPELKQLSLLSRIYGLTLALEAVPTCDKARFPWLCTCGNRRNVW